ncbi:efflux RND transporter periplasmic adaptor subunit [Leptolyngbya ohadii]|uniref:efflux RND transporter periplasmic adaptor subunit n=1 Tax=Leptolyngbya ohadii TaxID=1962290 RepID=UPI0019D493CE|nr:efflux RND transporter periplasmic adaptor subunit [Leptolyngbya ohadii]
MVNLSRLSLSLSRQILSATLLISTLVIGCSRNGETGQQGPPAFPVQVQPIETSRVETSSEFVGALEAQRKVELRPERDGRIVNLFVASGDRVQPGTPIVELRAEQNQAELSGASADVAAAQAARTTAQAQVSAAQAERQQALANARLQETEFARTQQLVTEGALSQQALDRARNNRDTARAALQAAEQNVRATQAALNEANARVGRAQADRASAGADLSESRITAPIAGEVSTIPVKVGDFVTTSTVITNIVQNQALDLNISVPIERAPQLRIGLPVQLVNEQGQAIGSGQISFISPQVNTAQQSVLAKASFPSSGQLRDGQFVRARVIWSSQPGLLVPTDAVSRIAGQTFVFVSEPGQPGENGQPQQIARQRKVELGDIQGNAYQVRSGLNPGDQIIVSGVLNLTDNAPITIAPEGSPSPAASP